MSNRLDEIKKYQSIKEVILKKEPDEDVHWLISRVEELEENLNDYQTINKELHQRIRKHRKEKQKYKQALEEIQSEASGYMSNSAAQRLYDIANEALEGEE